MSAQPARFGAPHRRFRSTDSTNARARALAKGGAASGTIVTADQQTAGRGRQGRDWFAPPGGALLYSAILRPIAPGELPLLPLAVPVAVAETAERLGAGRCDLKWPNDVWLDGRKLAGVLIEQSGDWCVIGVGLNVAIPAEAFPPELRATATSVGGDAGVDAATDILNERLAAWVAAEPAEVLEAFRARDALAGREISWEGGSGVAAGVDSLGHLLVDVGSGAPVALGAGEVHLSLA